MKEKPERDSTALTKSPLGDRRACFAFSANVSVAGNPSTIGQSDFPRSLYWDAGANVSANTREAHDQLENKTKTALLSAGGPPPPIPLLMILPASCVHLINDLRPCER